MRRLVLGVCTVLVMLPGVAVRSQPAVDIKAQTRAFLDAYARGNREALMPMVDGGALAIYGSDAAEVVHGSAAFTQLLANDQLLWGGHAVIGEVKDVSLVQEGTLASIFFDADFSVGGRPAVPVRFAMVWRLAGGNWLLVQSSNVVPTRGQSAAELLKQH